MNFKDTLGKVRPALDRAQNLVARAKHAVEQFELAFEKLK